MIHIVPRLTFIYMQTKLTSINMAVALCDDYLCQFEFKEVPREWK